MVLKKLNGSDPKGLLQKNIRFLHSEEVLEQSDEGGVVVTTQRSNGMNFSSSLQTGPPLLILENLPFFQFVGAFQERVPSLTAFGHLPAGLQSKRRPSNANAMIPQYPPPHIPFGGMVTPTAQAIEFLCDAQTSIGQAYTAFAPHFVKLMVFMVTNNLCQEEPANSIMKSFAKHANVKSLDFILPLIGPISDAFVEKAFRFAVEEENLSLVTALLEKGVHPDKVMWTKGGYLFNCLTFASNLRNLKLVRKLLAAGATITKLSKRRDDAEERPTDVLSCAIHPVRIYDHGFVWPMVSSSQALVDMQLIRTLVEAGANINVSIDHWNSSKPLLNYVVAQGHLPLVEFLLAKGADVNKSAQCGETALHALVQATSELDSATVLGIGKLLLGAGADVRLKFGTIGWLGPFSKCISFDDELIPINKVALSGNLELSQLLLSFGAEPNPHTLALAAESGNVNLVQYLMEVGKKLNISLLSSSGIELAAAIRGGNAEIVEQMFQWGVIPLSINSMNAAIKAAAGAGQQILLENLLEIAYKNENQRLLDVLPQDAVREAIYGGHYDVARYLINSGSMIHPNLVSAAIGHSDTALVQELLNDYTSCLSESDWDGSLWQAVRWGDHPTVNRLLSLGVNPNSQYDGCCTAGYVAGASTVLGVAVEKKDPELVQILVDAGAHPSPKSCFTSPLTVAVTQGSIGMTCLLLELGADPDDPDALKQAALASDLKTLNILITAYQDRYGACRRGYGVQALISAVEKCELSLIQALVCFGVDPSACVYEKSFIICEQKDKRALDTAIRVDRSHNLTVIRTLLEPAANSKSRDKKFQDAWPDARALFIAIESKNFPALEFLIETGADINQSAFAVSTASTKQTPLQVACKEGFVEAVQLLLQLGADVNSPPYIQNGATALQYAAIGGHVAIAVLLLTRGANVNAPAARWNGRTALEGAAEHGRIDMLQLLVNAGSNLDDIENKQYSRALKFASQNGHFTARRLLELARMGVCSG